MKNIDMSITQGVYVLSTKDSACIVDSVSEVSFGSNPLVAVAVNKNNYTHKKMLENNKYSLSILPKDVDGNMIKTFGFNSSRDTNKFESVKHSLIDDIKVIDDSIGYMIIEKEKEIDCDTHTLFIGRIVNMKRNNDKEELIYNYYLDNKDEYLKINIGNKTLWVCKICGYVYEGQELPDDFKCPVCGVSKEMFAKKI